MDDQELKEIAREMMSFPGKIRGEAFRTHAAYFKHKEGEEGLRKIESKMEELGVPIKFEEISSFEWVHEGISPLAGIVAKETFGWTNEDISQWGEFAFKNSFYLKSFIRYFISLEKACKEAPKHWSRQFTFGSLEVVEVNKEEKRVVIRIKDYKRHPITCFFMAGYMKGISKILVRTNEAFIEETKCMHKGDPYHEYKLTWL